MTPFFKALIWTAVPLTTLSLLSTAGAWREDLYFVWLLALLAWLVSLVVAAAFAIADKRETASGILFGFGFGFLALFVSCFVNLSGG